MGKVVPEYDSLEFTQHARERMQERRISADDVELTLRLGEGRPGARDTWVYEMRSVSGAGIRVVIKEMDVIARVITVIRLRRRS
jgi:hypothetical protein